MMTIHIVLDNWKYCAFTLQNETVNFINTTVLGSIAKDPFNAFKPEKLNKIFCLHVVKIYVQNEILLSKNGYSSNSVVL